MMVVHGPRGLGSRPAAALLDGKVAMSNVVVTDNPGEHRYEAHVDGHLAGFAEYVLTEELVVFTHTEVEPAFEGRGVGSALARFALDDVRNQGVRKVMAKCAFIKAWMVKHPEYQSLAY
jgi:predicted GNAT family acetyltransferase